MSYPVREAAVLLGLSERSVWTLVASGDLVSFKSNGSRLVAREDIAAYIEKQREEEQRARETAAAVA